jgi:cysteine-rich repeat protein
MWSGTSTADLAPGQVSFSTYSTTGGAVAADFEVASEIFCGNSALDDGEQCDDGNTANGDCCDANCQYEASASPCPADGDACTDDICDGAGGCGAQIDCDDGNACSQDSCDSGTGCANDFTPVSNCKIPGKSILLLKNDATDDSKDKLTFKWLKGAETTLGELGSPTGTTGYTLCLYAGTAAAAIAIPSGADWKPAGGKGFNYKEATGTGTPNGAQKVIVKSGAAGKSKVIVKGKGNDLPDSIVPALPLPVTAQFVNDANSTCFEAVYDSADVIKNDAKQFKAKAQ